MSKVIFTMVAAVAILMMVMHFTFPVQAQSYGSLSFGPIAPILANCPAGAKGQAQLCAVGTAAPFTMYASYDGGAYAPFGSGLSGAMCIGFGNDAKGNLLLNLVTCK